VGADLWPRSSQTSKFNCFDGFSEPELVWAIDGDHLRNYLVPRDCPRVTYYAGRVMPNLWPLHEAIRASCLRFSSIRLRNALLRPDA